MGGFACAWRTRLIKVAAEALRLLETIAALRRHTRDPVVRAALRRHADAIHRGSREGLKDPLDREDAERRHREAIEGLDGTADAPPPSGASP